MTAPASGTGSSRGSRPDPSPAPVLTAIVADVRRRLAERRARVSLADLRREVAPDPARGARFTAALRRPGLALIAECKRRSPSAGALSAEVDWSERARSYARGGASALSVLTEEDHFHGAPEHLREVERSGLPRLRKDFLLDESMVLESAAWGADAVLLLPSILDDARLAELHDIARSIGLAALVEVHTQDELERALALAPEIVGVNARDLATFEVDLATVERLLPRIPPSCVRVAESGIHSVVDLRRVRAAGADAALVGEALMRAREPEATLSCWTSAELPAPLRPPYVKVCGLTNVDDALAAVRAGCTAIGLIEHAPSPRAVSAERARAIVAALPRDVLPVAVLVDRTPDEALSFLERSGARAVQLCGRECASDWRSFPRPIFRRVAVAPGAEAELESWRAIATAFVLDHPDAPGGTGREVDLARARALAQRATCLLAGGLDEHNVAERVRASGAAGVDASSRLESAPGVKDRARVALFVERARAALAGCAA